MGKWCPRWLVKRLPGLVEPNLGLNGLDPGAVVLLPGDVQGLARGLRCLGKTARLGVGRCQCAEEICIAR